MNDKSPHLEVELTLWDTLFINVLLSNKAVPWWFPGLSDIKGNRVADELAKATKKGFNALRAA